jgi:hypothetical protein
MRACKLVPRTKGAKVVENGNTYLTFPTSTEVSPIGGGLVPHCYGTTSTLVENYFHTGRALAG